MLTLTFRAAHDGGACVASYHKFARYKGGIRQWGRDTPFPLAEVLEVLGLDDALWCLSICRPVEERARIVRLYAADCAEHVLPLYEAQYPGDSRVRDCIATVRAFARGEATAEQLSAAEAAAYAAWDAARSVARSAARSATWSARSVARSAAGAAWDAAVAAAWATDAAWSAERQWQRERLLDYLMEEKEESK